MSKRYSNQSELDQIKGTTGKVEPSTQFLVKKIFTF